MAPLRGRGGRAAVSSADATPLPPPTDRRAIDPRAVRAALGPSAAHAAVEPLVIEPPAVPLAPAPRAAGLGILGGVAPAADGSADRATDGSADRAADGSTAPAVRPASARRAMDEAGVVLVDGRPVRVHLVGREGSRATLELGEGDDLQRHAVLLMEPVDGPAAQGGIRRREVVVGGWRVDVEIESERRAALRERASKGRQAAARGGPTEVRAIIPGRVVSVSIVSGDDVVAGQQLLVVEAMKMQNELRAPRDGQIERVAVAAGQTIEVGDLLLVIS